ncbi:MAG: hypothetical protein ACREXG_03925, partial [Polaromonas sp.]
MSRKGKKASTQNSANRGPAASWFVGSGVIKLLPEVEHCITPPLRNALQEIHCLNPFWRVLVRAFKECFFVQSLQRNLRRNFPAVNVAGLIKQITCHKHGRAFALRYRSGHQVFVEKDEL